MLPDDANPAGNVHGGTILRMIDEAGSIASAKHANSVDGAPPTYTALARIEKTDFVAPMYVGEVATLVASVVATAPRSCEVQVDVFAEDLVSGVRRLTNSARLWYVATNGVLRDDDALRHPGDARGEQREQPRRRRARRLGRHEVRPQDRAGARVQPEHLARRRAQQQHLPRAVRVAVQRRRRLADHALRTGPQRVAQKR